MADLPLENPTANIDVDFAQYLAGRKTELAVHRIDDLPDYGFGLDNQLRKYISRMSLVRSAAHLIVSTQIQAYRQQNLQTSIEVGVDQFADIHALGIDCARRLGISAPKLFIATDGELNAYTIATEDSAPVVVLTTGLVNALTNEELHFVIGHECGHIHNMHGVYQTVVVMLINPLKNQVLMALMKASSEIPLVQIASMTVRGGLELLFRNWSRYAEVTCDRAGLICCGSLASAQSALVKLLTGGSERLSGLNIEALLRQIDVKKPRLAGFNELLATHPLIIKRLLALRLFAGSELFHSWRPDQPTGADALPNAELEKRCTEVVEVIKRWPWEKGGEQ
jgi:Zn-dependent protease with chaperone function